MTRINRINETITNYELMENHF
ncbi:MAG: hypothetical protein PWP38_2984, partial [Clostridiales bacterium]|nr:hypothetical protein [Clostridiales bacterium]